MKIRNLIADAVRETVKGVGGTASGEFKKAGRSMFRQVTGKLPLSGAPEETGRKKTYREYFAKGETKKFGLNLMSQVSGKKFTYQELQELEAASEGRGNTAHDQLRAKINQMYQSHDQMRKRQEEAAKQKQQNAEVKNAENRELESTKDQSNPLNPAIGKTRAEIGKNFGRE